MSVYIHQKCYATFHLLMTLYTTLTTFRAMHICSIALNCMLWRENGIGREKSFFCIQECSILATVIKYLIYGLYFLCCLLFCSSFQTSSMQHSVCISKAGKVVYTAFLFQLSSGKCRKVPSLSWYISAFQLFLFEIIFLIHIFVVFH